MKLSFTTLGCPKWDLNTICAKAREYGYDGIDLRGILGELDVTKTPAFTTHLAATRRTIQDAGLEVAGVSTGISLCDSSRLYANIEEARRFLALALDLNCPNIRVFGGGDLKAVSREDAAKAGRDCLQKILKLDGAPFVNWLVETHDNWIASADILQLVDGLNHPSIGILWDIGHTPRVAKEKVADTYNRLRHLIRYLHIKDAIFDQSHPLAMQDGWRYVAPGEGQLPLAEAIGLLKAGGYDGYLTFEHEKHWHPNLPEPEEIFPKFTAWARKVLA